MERRHKFEHETILGARQKEHSISEFVWPFDLWYSTMSRVYRELLMESITAQIGLLSGHYGYLLTVIRDAWLEFSELIEKQHWLKSHPYLRQKVPDSYSATQSEFFSFYWVEKQKQASVLLLRLRHRSQYLTIYCDVSNWNLEHWQRTAWSDESWFRADGRVWVWHRPH